MGGCVGDEFVSGGRVAQSNGGGSGGGGGGVVLVEVQRYGF